MSVTYFDLDLFADVTASGGIQVKYGVDAFYEALTSWLTSMPHDYIRNPAQGGILARQIDKLLGVEQAESIRVSILAGLAVDFEPFVTVSSVTVLPDFETDSWFIAIRGYVPELKELISYEQNFRRAA
jgi:hypothetical protein